MGTGDLAMVAQRAGPEAKLPGCEPLFALEFTTEGTLKANKPPCASVFLFVK